MDTYSSGEDLVIKTRKPYTITKQRERWTEEEHNRFLEALKLYGRAWQRIEEHIGTKSAVQIRSHAQKFFSKLEKEAVAKGVPVGQALDIEIPPPRPKRKPSNPYPRKTIVGPITAQVGTKDGNLLTPVSFPRCKQVLDLEKEPVPEKPNEDELETSAKENQDDNCSEVFTLLPEAHCSSVSSVNKNSIPEALRKGGTFREFIPSPKEVVNHNSTDESYANIELEPNPTLDKSKAKQIVKVSVTSTNKASKLENSFSLNERSVHRNKSDDMPTDEMQAMHYPRHVPVHIVDGSLGTCIQKLPQDMSLQDSMFQPIGEVHVHPNSHSNPTVSTITESQSSAPRSCTQQSFLPFPPFAPTHHNQDDYRSFLHMSSTFSSLIVSTLLQNPAAHAAASFAATFWPHGNVESSGDSPACIQEGFPSRQMSSAPSVAAIAAATVAAATAWWAAHGLLPMCAPLHAAFTCPASVTTGPSTGTGQVPMALCERKETPIEDPPAQGQQLDPEKSEATRAPNPALKSQSMSASDSEESGVATENKESKSTELEMVAATEEVHDSNQGKSRKLVDRSSCGSNTASSSEVETDALKNNEERKEEIKETDVNNSISESNNRRARTTCNTTDAWKEVSEEGRLAFQALFSRQVLPQSFSPPHDMKNNVNQNDNIQEETQKAEEKNEDCLLLDLNSKNCTSCSGQEASEKNASPSFEDNAEEGLLTMELGYGKLKARRTGFKPYKRCSMELKENRTMTTSGQGEEQCPKRIRLEGEALS